MSSEEQYLKSFFTFQEMDIYVSVILTWTKFLKNDTTLTVEQNAFLNIDKTQHAQLDCSYFCK